MNTKYTIDILSPLVASSLSVSEVMRKLGLRMAGGTHFHLSRRIRILGIDTSHFLGGRVNSGIRHRRQNKLTADQILVKRPNGARRGKTTQLKRALLERGLVETCNKCGLKDEWQNKKLVLQINHVNGNITDDREENLEFLCPNCHSQTPTYGIIKGRLGRVAQR